MMIKANEELFDRVKTIIARMNDLLPSIVQNDMVVSHDQWIEFWDQYDRLAFQLDDWMVKVKDYVRALNRNETLNKF